MTDQDDIPPPPDGFVPSRGSHGYSTHNGPYFHHPAAPGARRAFYSLPRHANGLGLVHGGMLSSFADTLLAGAVFAETKTIGLTVHLSIDFLHMARIGEWVMGEAKMTRATRDIAFADGRLYVGERDVVRASGIFKLTQRPA